MAAEASRRVVVAGDGTGTRMKLLCSHGGRLQPRRPGGAIRYVGGETRVLAIPRDASFRELAARLAEMAGGGGGGAEVRAVRHRLADEALEDVLVSVTCDEELAHMRDEYDRLRATRPAARFRVFVDTTAPAPAISGAGSPPPPAAAAAELPPLAPKMRRVQSEQAQLHRRPAVPAPVRRVQSAPEFAGAVNAQPRFQHHRHQQCCCSGQRHGMCAPAPAPAPARPTYAAPYMSMKAMAAPSTTPAAKAAGQKKVMSRDAMEERRAIWEFE